MVDVQYGLVRQSNDYIQGKYKLSLLQQKLLTIGISRVQSSPTGELSATIKASEIRTITGLKGSGIYTQLRELSDAIQNHRILITDRTNNSFESFVIIPTCRYKDGDFTIYFNQEMKKHILDIQGPYTVLRLDSLLYLDNSFTFRIFQLLSSLSYGLKKGRKEVLVPYGVSELKFAIGVYDPEMTIYMPVGERVSASGEIKTRYRKTTVAKEISEGHITWDEAISLIDKKDRHYEDWYSFRSRILDVAKRELASSDKNEIVFDYEMEKSGRGGKVVSDVFHVMKNPKYKPAELRKEEENIIVSQLGALMEEEQLSYNELLNICRDGNWDFLYIEETYELAKKQPYIKNFVGWMRDALRKRYVDREPIETMSGRNREEIEVINDVFDEVHDPEMRKEIAARVRSRKSILDSDNENNGEDEKILAALKKMSKEQKDALLDALQ